MDGLSNSDVALLSDRDGMGGGMGFFWIFALLLLAGGGFGGFGGRGDYVSQADLAASQANQTQQLALNNLGIQVANNNYETAQLINQQSMLMTQQNNTNNINAIQGFNQLQAQISQLGAKMDSCCCEIKTQMLQDRLTDTQAKLVTAQNAIDNANQSQYILGQLGRFVAWAGSGAPATVTSGS